MVLDSFREFLGHVREILLEMAQFWLLFEFAHETLQRLSILLDLVSQLRYEGIEVRDLFWRHLRSVNADSDVKRKKEECHELKKQVLLFHH